jgi:hypothetical protein
MSGHTNTNYTYSVRKSGAYTMTTTDEHVVVTSSATITLPSIATFLAAGVGVKTYAFEVSGSGVTITIAQNSADTIDGSSSNVTITGDGTILELVSDSVRKNWEVASHMPYLSSDNLKDNAVTTAKITNGSVTGAKTSLTKHYPTIVADTSGTDPATTAGLVTGEEGALTNASVSAAAAVTVESSTTNGDGRVHILFEVTA